MHLESSTAFYRMQAGVVLEANVHDKPTAACADKLSWSAACTASPPQHVPISRNGQRHAYQGLTAADAIGGAEAGGQLRTKHRARTALGHPKKLFYVHCDNKGRQWLQAAKVDWKAAWSPAMLRPMLEPPSGYQLLPRGFQGIR
eukprot:1161268-Pelagomonas_calceolata.AAC.12